MAAAVAALAAAWAPQRLHSEEGDDNVHKEHDVHAVLRVQQPGGRLKVKPKAQGCRNSRVADNATRSACCV